MQRTQTISFFTHIEHQSCFAFNHSELINKYCGDLAWESFLKFYSLKNLYISLMTGNFTAKKLKELILIEKRLDINELIDNEETLLHHIVRRVNSKIDINNTLIIFLLELGAKINSVNSKGLTPLDVVSYNCKEIYDVLRNNGAKHSQEIKNIKENM
jgi:hypothetical protein